MNLNSEAVVDNTINIAPWDKELPHGLSIDLDEYPVEHSENARVPIIPCRHDTQTYRRHSRERRARPQRILPDSRPTKSEPAHVAAVAHALFLAAKQKKTMVEVRGVKWQYLGDYDNARQGI